PDPAPQGRDMGEGTERTARAGAQGAECLGAAWAGLSFRADQREPGAMSSCTPETATRDGQGASAPTPSRPVRHPVVTALALSAGTAALVGAEFIPAGVLPGMATDLAVSEGRAGLTVAATALAGALTAPTIASVLPRADRRAVLLALLGLAIVSNLVVAVAPTLAVVLAARILLGTAIAGFWSFALSVGVHVTGRAALVST